MVPSDMSGSGPILRRGRVKNFNLKMLKNPSFKGLKG